MATHASILWDKSALTISQKKTPFTMKSIRIIHIQLWHFWNQNNLWLLPNIPIRIVQLLLFQIFRKGSLKRKKTCFVGVNEDLNCGVNIWCDTVRKKNTQIYGLSVLDAVCNHLGPLINPRIAPRRNLSNFFARFMSNYPLFNTFLSKQSACFHHVNCYTFHELNRYLNGIFFKKTTNQINNKKVVKINNLFRIYNLLSSCFLISKKQQNTLQNKQPNAQQTPKGFLYA